MKASLLFIQMSFLVLVFLIGIVDNTYCQSSAMSYNIRYNNPNDGINKWDQRKQSVVDLILQYQPDVLGIQEGLNHQVTYLDSTLTHYNFIGVGRDDGKTKGEYTAILYNSGRLQLINDQTRWLSPSPDTVSVGWDASMERIVSYAKFYDVRDLDTFHVFNAHFDHIGKEARKQSALLILNWIKELNILNKKVLVMGDFNCLPESPPLETFKELLKDPTLNKNLKFNGPKGTFNHFDPDASLLDRIDYILTLNYDTNYYQHVDQRREHRLWPSDHLPVYMRLK